MFSESLQKGKDGALMDKTDIVVLLVERFKEPLDFGLRSVEGEVFNRFCDPLHIENKEVPNRQFVLSLSPNVQEAGLVGRFSVVLKDCSFVYGKLMGEFLGRLIHPRLQTSLDLPQ